MIAFARAVVLSDVGGFPELAETRAARIFPAGDAAALQSSLSELLSDPDALRAMAENARAAAAGRYSWASVAARTLELYDSLLRQNRRA